MAFSLSCAARAKNRQNKLNTHANNTTQPTTSSTTTTVSKAKILGNHELFVKTGSDINLTCIASQISNPPSFIYWYKGGRVVNYSQRGGINVQTDRNTKTSKLIIARATPGDSGNYTCAPSNSGERVDDGIKCRFMRHD